MTELPEQSEVPIWPRFIPHVLQVLSDGSIVRRRDLVARVLDSAELSESARAERIAVGDGRADNRVGWALTSLFKAGWVERPERAKYRITPDGLKWLRENPDAEPDFGDANRLFKEYWPHTQPQHGESAGIIADAATESEISPIEQIESGIARITEEVADDLLTRLRDSDPSFFEDAVVRLLLAMGYCGAEQRGKRIGGTGDGGVDGVIDQDALGLERIYVQAKRYAAHNSVGREAIQAFIGALHGLGANRGIFLTTSTFTRQALDYAEQIPTRIVLIDGTRLVSLMVAYRVGVQTTQTYHVVEVDEDFFE